MKTENIVLEVTRIDSSEGLDPITIFWQDFGNGRGSVTILCYDMAWTSYFAAMGKSTIKKFFSEVNTEYMIDKLSHAQFLKTTAGHKKYMARIVERIKKVLVEA